MYIITSKSNPDKDDISYYRPISYLSFLSKLTERVVKSRLVYYLFTNNLFNSLQSAYIKCHSTETNLSVYDHIIKAMSNQQVIVSHFFTYLLIFC